MAKEIVWSHQATLDLFAIADYISKDSEFYAAAFVEESLTVARSLARFGKRGRVVPEIGKPENTRSIC